MVSGVIPLRAYLRPQSDFALGAYSKGSVATRFQTNGISRRIASRWTGSFIVCGDWGQCVRVRSGVRERRWVGGVSGRKATSARGKGITGTIRYNYSTASQNEEQRRQERERERDMGGIERELIGTWVGTEGEKTPSKRSSISVEDADRQAAADLLGDLAAVAVRQAAAGLQVDSAAWQQGGRAAFRLQSVAPRQRAVADRQAVLAEHQLHHENASVTCVRQLSVRVRKYLVVQAVQLCCLHESVAWQQWALAAWEPMAPLVAPLSARAESRHCRRLGSSWVCCGTEEAPGARCRRGTTNETLHTCSTR